MNKEKLSIKIAKELSFFNSNPSKRCVDDSKCRYSGESLGLKTKGCLIGRLIPKQVRLDADKKESMGLPRLIEEFGSRVPKYIRDNEDLFSVAQRIHDGECRWNENGLSEAGVDSVKSMIKTYNLNEDVFKEYNLIK